MKPDYLSLILEIIDSPDNKEALDLSGLSRKDIKQLLKIANSNRVLFALSRKIREHDYLGLRKEESAIVDAICDVGEHIMNQYASGLKKIKDKFYEKNISFLIVKTDRKVDYVLSDVDLLVRKEDFERALEILRLEATSNNRDDKKARWHYRLNNRVEIDIHKEGTDWYSDDFINMHSLWEYKEERQFMGNVYSFPSAENEWIFNALNIAYEKYALTLLDWLYFRKCQGINRDRVNQISQEHGWGTGLRIFDKYFNRVEGAIVKEVAGDRISLPIMFSFIDFLKIFSNRLFCPYKNHRISSFFFLYFIFCKIRFYITGGRRLSYAGEWFKF